MIFAQGIPPFFSVVNSSFLDFISSGWFSGLAEVKYRKVRQRDIQNLTKAESLRDLWNNNIVRILLVVVGTNIAVSIATLVILPSQVFIPLFMKIFGM